MSIVTGGREIAFWSDYSVQPDGKGFEPLRKFTFLLSLAGNPPLVAGGAPPNVPAAFTVENYLIKKVKRPGFEVSESEHKFLNHSFFYPGKLKWKEVTFTVVDIISPNTSKRFLELLQNCGYRAPQGPTEPGNANSQTISKLRSVEAIGRPIIRQIDADGRTVNEWFLKGAWIKDVEFGELDYDAEDLMSIDVTLRYDYAFLRTLQPNDSTSPSNAS